jgi:hypothetical protein
MDIIVSDWITFPRNATIAELETDINPPSSKRIGHIAMKNIGVLLKTSYQAGVMSIVMLRID